MTIKTIDVPFFGNPEHSTGNGSVSVPQDTNGRKKSSNDASHKTPKHSKVGQKKTNQVNDY